MNLYVLPLLLVRLLLLRPAATLKGKELFVLQVVEEKPMQEPEVETMTNLPPWLVQFAFLNDPGPPTKIGTTHSELGLPR